MAIKKRFALPSPAHPAVIAAWAAAVAASHIVPALPMLGTGSNFSLAAALSPLSGIFFGPIAGALCAAAGSFVGSQIAPHTAWMSLATFIPPTATAFTAGCIAWGGWPPVALDRRGSFAVSGGIIVYLIGALLWFSQEAGRGMALFPLVYYGLGFAAFIAGSLFSRKALAGKNQAAKIFALWLCAFGGMVGGAGVGNFFFMLLYRPPREYWLYLMAAAPIERAVFSLGAALVAAPLLAGLPKIGIFVGPREEEYDED